MKKNTSPVQAVMNEYVMWGGPVVTRHEAYKDGQLRGFDARMLDYTVFGRPAVAAPENPEWHVEFLRHIQEMDGLLVEAAA